MGIINALELAKSIPGISMLQNNFDRNPFLFNCANGTYDLEHNNFYEHNKSDHLTKSCEVKYDPNAEAPYWYESLNLIFDGDEELIRFIQQAVGYSLSGLVDEEVLFFCYGKGANGKSRFFDVMELLTGDYYLKSHSDLVTTSKFQSNNNYHIAHISGKRFVVASELDKSQIFNSAIVKDLTGGDTISARFIYGDTFEFTPVHKLWMFGNDEPRVHATDEGFWRRMRKIPFTVEIPEKKRIPKSELLKINRNELSGILNWAIIGFQDYYMCGKLIIPASVENATKEYRSDSDVIGNFFSDYCKNVEGAMTPVKIIYEKYKHWCDENNEYTLTRTIFNKLLQEKGYEKPLPKTNNIYMWKGLELISTNNTN